LHDSNLIGHLKAIQQQIYHRESLWKNSTIYQNLILKRRWMLSNVDVYRHTKASRVGKSISGFYSRPSRLQVSWHFTIQQG